MTKPNIVLIVSDQHRGDWMGCAGHPFVNTPYLDQLAAGGVRFTNAYCNSPLCVPSRMSMMTGRHPHATGVHTNENSLSSDIPTFAHALSLGGYETVLCGRMHFVGPDQRHGYEQRLVQHGQRWKRMIRQFRAIRNPFILGWRTGFAS